MPISKPPVQMLVTLLAVVLFITASFVAFLQSPAEYTGRLMLCGCVCVSSWFLHLNHWMTSPRPLPPPEQMFGGVFFFTTLFLPWLIMVSVLFFPGATVLHLCQWLAP